MLIQRDIDTYVMVQPRSFGRFALRCCAALLWLVGWLFDLIWFAYTGASLHWVGSPVQWLPIVI